MSNPTDKVLLDKARAALLRCLKAMGAWGQEEDGIPDTGFGFGRVSPWSAYVQGCRVLGIDVNEESSEEWSDGPLH